MGILVNNEVVGGYLVGNRCFSASELAVWSLLALMDHSQKDLLRMLALHLIKLHIFVIALMEDSSSSI